MARLILIFFPSFLIKLNKILNIIISFSVFIFFFIFIYKSFKDYPQKPDFTLLVLFIIVVSFWGINFLFVTGTDANRYKFPAEPFIIGLFIYFVKKLLTWINDQNQSKGNHYRHLLSRSIKVN